MQHPGPAAKGLLPERCQGAGGGAPVLPLALICRRQVARMAWAPVVAWVPVVAWLADAPLRKTRGLPRAAGAVGSAVVATR